MKNRNILKKIYLKIKKIVLKILNLFKKFYYRTLNKILKLLRKLKKKIKITKNLYYTIKSIIFSCIISTILLIVILLILPKVSWINLSLKPEDFKIYNFTGNGLVNATYIVSNKIILSNNMSDITLIINNEKYNVKQGDLKIIINKEYSQDEDFYEKYSELNLDEIYAFSLSSNKNVNLKFENFIESDLKVRRNYVIFRKDLQIKEQISSDESFDIYINSDNAIKGIIEIYNDTHINLFSNALGKIEIYIDGNKVETTEDNVSLEFFSNDGKDFVTQMYFLCDSIAFKSLDLKNNFYIRGKCESFDGISSGVSTLKQTFFDKQREYDISLLKIASASNDKFQLEYEYYNEKNNLQLSGSTEKINIAGNSLNNNVHIFLLENEGEIITGIFAAFIAAYIPMIISNKKE